jgi:hypothetical protein
VRDRSRLKREARLGDPGASGRLRPHAQTSWPNLTSGPFSNERGRWVLADLEGKGLRIRAVAIPIRVKLGINAWMTAACIEDGGLLRSVSKSGKVNRDSLHDWAVRSIVEQVARLRLCHPSYDRGRNWMLKGYVDELCRRRRFICHP